MENKRDLIAAIDIGTTKIVALIGRVNENKKIDILGMASRPSTGVKRGVVLNIEETTKSIKGAVEELEQKTGIKLKEVYVGIAGQHIKSLKQRCYINRDSYDDITKEDVDRLIADGYKTPVEEGEEIIHVIPQNFIVDNEPGVKQPIGYAGRRLEANFHIVIGEKASARNIEKCINRVGLTVKEFILEPIASSEAVLTEEETELGVALVDIGGGTTDLAIIHEGAIIHTAVIPFGGNVINNDVKSYFGILETQAEKLKVGFGSALGEFAPENQIISIPGIGGREPKEISSKILAGIIQSRMNEILAQVMYEIDNLDLIGRLHAGIVVTGGGALLKNLPQLIKFKTGLDVRIGYAHCNINSNNSIQIESPIYATGVGLIFKGSEYMKKEQSSVDYVEETIEETMNVAKEDEVSQVAEIDVKINSEPYPIINISNETKDEDVNPLLTFQQINKQKIQEKSKKKRGKGVLDTILGSLFDDTDTKM